MSENMWALLRLKRCAPLKGLGVKSLNRPLFKDVNNNVNDERGKKFVKDSTQRTQMPPRFIFLFQYLKCEQAQNTINLLSLLKKKDFHDERRLNLNSPG